MKKRTGLKIAALIAAALVVFLAIINLIPPKQNVEHNPFVLQAGERTMIAAHRGGGANHPENTLLAFREAVNTTGVDILESDLYLTRDGCLVYNHDAYIDRTCDVNGGLSPEENRAFYENEENRHYIADLTLEELQQYNFGYYFTEEDGSRPYEHTADPAAAGLQIATAEELFAEFYESHPDLLFIVEIKDGGDRGREACRLLWEILQNYPEYQDQIVVGTFHDEIGEELEQNYPQLLRGAPLGAAAKFVLTQYLGVNLFERSEFACLQIPTEYDLGITVPLDNRSLIRRAHRRNVAVQYWTINDPAEMRQLIGLGADCIMTDDPILLKQVLQESK